MIAFLALIAISCLHFLEQKLSIAFAICIPELLAETCMHPEQNQCIDATCAMSMHAAAFLAAAQHLDLGTLRFLCMSLHFLNA